MFPDGNHQVNSPKFFTLTLTDAYGVHTYLYNLKFPSSYYLSKDKKITIPLVISIKSNKQDLEPFKELLYAVYQVIINNDLNIRDYSNDVLNNYKKIELINLFTFCFALIKPSPHSMIKLKLDSDLYNSSLEEMEFYFHSNCEIPCNKDDKDINMLFSILDQSIIVKIVFSILTEKQIIIRASQSFVLHLIFPAFLKLIFPFQWIHSYLPVLPSEQLELLEKPGSYLFGVLSSSITLDGLIQTYPGRVIVDCDTNEIIDNEQYIAPRIGDGLLQGRNVVIVQGERIYIENKNQKNVSFKDNLSNRGNLIIDCTNDIIYIDKSYSYLNVEEWNKFKRKMQLIKNPETFGVENLRKNRNATSYDEEDSEIILLPNRSFSYNVQNVFLEMFLDKMSYPNKEFMLMFKATNLYKIYKDPHKYQNDCGHTIVSNIEKTKDNPRSYLNSFNIEYQMKPFPSKLLLNIIEESKDEIPKNDKDIIQEVINDYYKIERVLNEEPFFPNLSNINSRLTVNVLPTQLMKCNSTSNSNSNTNKKIKRRLSFTQKQIKSNNNMLYQMFRNNNDIFNDNNKSNEENEFLFYGDKGLLNFLKTFFTSIDGIFNIDDYVYKKKLIYQIAMLVQNELCLGNNDDTSPHNEQQDKRHNRSDIELIYNNSNVKVKASPKIERGMCPISEHIKENENDSIDSGNNVFNDSIGSKSNDSDYILTFDNLNEDNTCESNGEQINHQIQYYLFIAFYLEEFKLNKEHLDMFLNEFSEQININELIFTFYQKAFGFCDKKEYTYYNLYLFLDSLSYDELSLLEPNPNYTEIKDIYTNVLDSKESNHKKKQGINRGNSDAFYLDTTIRGSGFSKLSTLSSRSNASIGFEKVPSGIYIETNNEPQYSSIQFKTSRTIIDINTNDILHKIGDKLSISSDDNITSLFPISSYNTDSKGKYYDEGYKKKIVINDDEKFYPFVDPLSWNIIRELSQLIELCLPDLLCTQTKSTETILEETHETMANCSAIIELVSELKKIKLEKLFKSKQRIVFWTNCFNYLLLFTIFYKKWNLNNETAWRYFFSNVYYNIGGKEFSFNDMQYILFDKILFFNNSYRPSSYVKEMTVSFAMKMERDYKKKTDVIDISYFCLYLPTKELPGPKIITEEEVDCQMPYRSTNYFTGFLCVDAYENLRIPELVLLVEPQFLGKSLEKYRGCLGSDIYELIENKAYKETIKMKISWELNFEYLRIQKVEKFKGDL